MQLTAEQRVTKALIWMLRDSDFMGIYPVAMVGQTKVIDDGKAFGISDGMQTAFTDGRNTYFFRKFVDTLSDEELRFVILHENFHKLYRHICNWEHLFRKNPMLANVSCDARVNADILAHKNIGVQMPKNAVFIEKYEDSGKWDVRSIYADLEKNGHKGGKCDGNCKPYDGSNGVPNSECTCQQGFDAHGWDEAKGMTAEEQRLLAQDIDQAIRQGQRLAGQNGGKKDRSISDLLKVKIDYHSYLHEFLRQYTKNKDELTWGHVSRRGIANDVLTPGAITEAMGELGIFIDSSGSIGQQELTLFLSNVAHITKTIKPMKITVAFWDTECYAHQTFEPHEYDQLAKKVLVKGGGGTQVGCVVKYLAEKKLKPEAIVILSDGYLFDACPNFPAPTLWSIIDNQSFTAPAPQKTVHIAMEDLR